MCQVTLTESLTFKENISHNLNFRFLESSIAKEQDLRKKMITMLSCIFIIGFLSVSLVSSSCSEVNLQSTIVGGGFTKQDASELAVVYNYGSTSEIVWMTQNGQQLRSEILPQGAVGAVTCPQLGYIMVAGVAYVSGVKGDTIKFFIYDAYGANFATTFKTQYEAGYQMYFSPDCSKILIRVADTPNQENEIWYLAQNITYGYSFPAGRDGNLMQFYPDSEYLLTGNGPLFTVKLYNKKGVHVTRYLLPKPKIAYFAPSSTYAFVLAQTKNKGVFKYVLRYRGKRKVAIDTNPSDIAAVWAGFSPNADQMAAVLNTTSGTVLKVSSPSLILEFELIILP